MVNSPRIVPVHYGFTNERVVYASTDGALGQRNAVFLWKNSNKGLNPSVGVCRG